MKCPSPIIVKDPRSWTNDKKMIGVPCGKCGACRKNRRASWSFRLTQELKVSKNAYFITLTYTNDELPKSESGIYPSLRKTDWQKFIKRLRKKNKKNGWDNLRYYGVGEYGSKTGRPHYHCIAYNICNHCINQLSNVWGYGHCKADRITPARIHYVTKFHVNAKHDEYDREEEFATMSRNPGIGLNYVEANKKWHKENEFHHVINNGYKQKLPRYYKEKIFSKGEQMKQADKWVKEADEQFWREYERLEELGIENPIVYMQEACYKDAKKVNDKKENHDTF